MGRFDAERGEPVANAIADRRQPGQALNNECDAVVAAAAELAVRVQRGGTLFTVGLGRSRFDAQHVAVEFVHPVLVGKRAIPSVHLEPPHVERLRLLARPNDALLLVSAEGDDEACCRVLEEARRADVLGVALLSAGAGALTADHVLRVPAGDPIVARELQVTVYHLLWELVHVLLERDDVVLLGERVPDPARCAPHEACLTCSDEAVPVRIVELRADGLALVDTGRGMEEVSVALIQARVGDTALVHAREAIAVLAD